MTKLEIRAFLRDLQHDTSGATAIEYGLLVALLGVALITGMNGMGNQLKSTFNVTSGQMATANAAAA